MSRRGRSPARVSHKPEVRLAPAFKLAFITATTLTVVSLAVAVWLAIKAEQNDAVKGLVETCSTTWKIGFGAIVGLIGGKTLP